MTFFFRTKRFDAESVVNEDHFYGEDLADWLCGELIGWETNVDWEDWGWAVSAGRGEHSYIFGVYDHDTSDVNELGPRWCLRLYSQFDSKLPWYRRVFRSGPLPAHPEVIAEIEALLRRQQDFYDIQMNSEA